MTKNNLIYLIAFIIIIFATYFFLRGDKDITNSPPKNDVVVAFGDSLIEGVGSTSGNDFVSLVGRSLGIEIINKGRSGDTTTTALNRVNNVLALDPGIVLVLLGGNDVLRRISKEKTFQNLEQIIETFQSNGTVVMLLGVRGGILFDGYEDDYKNLAKEHGAAYVSNVLDGLITKPEYMYDGIHPNNKGYAIIAERVTPILEKLLKKP